MNGVPLIAWPLFAEQKMNAILLTEDLKVALRPSDSSECFPRKEHPLSLILTVYSLSRLRSIGSLFGTFVLNIGVVCGEIDFGIESGDESIPQFTPEKGIIPPNQNIQQMETALRELLERQTREVEIASEAMKRAKAIVARQQALLEEAEKRDQELKQKLQNRLSYIDEDEGVGDSCSRTWKPSIVAGNPPAREHSKHPFSLAICNTPTFGRS
ncbi:hypothetical protein PIB30_049582 [Stylosanthes scabra]|uniref:Uncharacterized protein n=1 Tax=Stylosanthes scabra TaxID=79078 RepID=A0ABU6THT0_9FABA|nr:hypothetical protein [Stylosanthes scabra]